ncbi:hypothetical protein vseg_011857 [Gypsophila vaccaria]
MGKNSMNNDHNNHDNGCQWTNERHSNFLSSMEASFVRSMFEKKVDNNNNNNHNNFNDNNNIINGNGNGKSNSNNNESNNNTSYNSRLDRFVPDIAESTLDLQSRKFTPPGAIVRVLEPVMSFGITSQRHRPQARSSKASFDQVVPQVEDRVGGK